MYNKIERYQAFVNPSKSRCAHAFIRFWTYRLFKDVADDDLPNYSTAQSHFPRSHGKQSVGLNENDYKVTRMRKCERIGKHVT